MSTRKSTAFYIVLTAVASLAVGMVIAARLDLAPASSAQTVNVPVANNAPLAGPIDATTFRNIAKYNAGAVVNIQTEVRQRGRDLTEYFGGGDDLLRRFFGGEDPQPPRGGRNRGQPRGQDAPIMGPDTYDLVSLLRDSYVDLPQQTVDELIAYFLAVRSGVSVESDEADEYRRRFDVMSWSCRAEWKARPRISTLSCISPTAIQRSTAQVRS